MFTGASNAHVAILLVDARAGVLRQTRRHARIAKLLGIKHFVATVNKIDLVDFDQTRFERSKPSYRSSRPAWRHRGHRDPDRGQARRQRRARLGAHPWYDGPTLLEYLESVELAAPQAEPSRLRLPVQWVSRPTAECVAATPGDSRRARSASGTR